MALLSFSLKSNMVEDRDIPNDDENEPLVDAPHSIVVEVHGDSQVEVIQFIGRQQTEIEAMHLKETDLPFHALAIRAFIPRYYLEKSKAPMVLSPCSSVNCRRLVVGTYYFTDVLHRTVVEYQ